jgi:hypothetical protein
MIRTNGVNTLCFLYYILLNYLRPYKYSINFKIEGIVIKSIIFT